jgi:hypothetical protein
LMPPLDSIIHKRSSKYHELWMQMEASQNFSVQTNQSERVKQYKTINLLPSLLIYMKSENTILIDSCLRMLMQTQWLQTWWTNKHSLSQEPFSFFGEERGSKIYEVCIQRTCKGDPAGWQIWLGSYHKKGRFQISPSASPYNQTYSFKKQKNMQSYSTI